MTRICPNCSCTQLFLVPYSFFVFCCSRRCLSRCKHCSTAAKGPRSQTVSERERRDILETVFRLSRSSDTCERQEGGSACRGLWEHLVQADSEPWSRACPSENPGLLQRCTGSVVLLASLPPRSRLSRRDCGAPHLMASSRACICQLDVA